jgi:hypothetical protein
MANSDRRSYDIAVSQGVQSDLKGICDQLDSLIQLRDGQVRSAMADFQADGVSDRYQDAERRWRNAADQVTTIIGLIRGTLEKNDATAHRALQRAGTAVANIA